MPSEPARAPCKAREVLTTPELHSSPPPMKQMLAFANGNEISRLAKVSACGSGREGGSK